MMETALVVLQVGYTAALAVGETATPQASRAAMAPRAVRTRDVLRDERKDIMLLVGGCRTGSRS
ncbi:hypothetical protein GCM10010478_10170 [Streptomyces erythrogriseus]|uniref:Secreted protein n=2 Tax=Streptomyces griseoincarnatus group TaxID=2867193 RepID=A0ABN3WF79_9ACTN|nr:hypothetical protein GCM10010287_21000 [Streptomyces variabilis]